MKTKKEQFKQKIIAVFVVTFMFVMVFGSIDINNVGAIGGNTTVQLTLTSGALSLESPTQVNFNSVPINAVAYNTLANLTQVNFRDTRGSGVGYNVVGSANNMQAGTNVIANSYLGWSPGSIFALDGASNTGVTAGAAYSGNFGDGARTMVSATSNNGMGNYVINGTTLNVQVRPSFITGTYQSTLLLTIA